MQQDLPWYADASIWHWLAHTVQWGTAPAWFAFVAAGAAAVFTGRNLRISSATRKEDVDQKRKFQASVVAAWLESTTENIRSDNFRVLSRYVAVMGANGSGLPVYEMTIWVQVQGEAPWPLVDIPALTPSPEPLQIKSATVELSKKAPADSGWLPVFQELGHLRLATQFRDTANGWWFRDFDGTLSEGKSVMSTVQQASEARFKQIPIEPPDDPPA